MRPPRRPRDRLARVLRATADRLSAPSRAARPALAVADRRPALADGRSGLTDGRSGLAVADGRSALAGDRSAGLPPRRPGEPPEHWLRLVAAHAPGLLHDLPHPPPPDGDQGVDVGSDHLPDANSVLPDRPSRLTQLWRRWRTRPPGGIGSPRSWYERAPIGADSYQDLQLIPTDGTEVPFSGSWASETGAAAGRSDVDEVAAWIESAGPDLAEGPARVAAGREPSGAGPARRWTWTGRNRAVRAASSEPAPGDEPFGAAPDAAASASTASGGGPATRHGTPRWGDRPGAGATSGWAGVTGPGGTRGRAGTSRPGGTAAPGAAGPGTSGSLGSAEPGGTAGPDGTAGPRMAGPGTAGPGTAGPGTAGPGTTGPGTTSGSLGTTVSAGTTGSLGAAGPVGAAGAGSGRSSRRAGRLDRNGDRVGPPDVLPHLGRRALGQTGTGADGRPAPDGVLPLSFAPVRRGSSVADAARDTGSTRLGPARVAGASRADGSDRSRGGEPWVPAMVDDGGRRGAHHRWPALPDEAGASGRAGRPADGRGPAGGGAGAGAAHRDRWPALPDEPAPWPAAAPRATWRESRLDREQAGG